jgi:hypothetical protein
MISVDICEDVFKQRHPEEPYKVCARKDGGVTIFNKRHVLRFDRWGKECLTRPNQSIYWTVYPCNGELDELKKSAFEVILLDVDFGMDMAFGSSMSKIPKELHHISGHYLIRFDNGIYKVGKTFNLGQRISYYLTYMRHGRALYNPRGFTLKYVIRSSGGLRLDTYFRHICAKYQISGEHFSKIDPALDYLLWERAIKL